MRRLTRCTPGRGIHALCEVAELLTFVDMVLVLLEDQFPWLATDSQTAVSGAETVDQLIVQDGKERWHNIRLFVGMRKAQLQTQLDQQDRNRW